MKHINFIFQVHQPYRLRDFNFFEIGGKHQDYFNEELNRDIIQRIAENSYGPANELLLKAIQKYGDAVKINFAISGTAIDQLASYAPTVLDSFKELSKTGNVEFLGQTYSHSLPALKSRMTFFEEVKAHSDRVFEVFKKRPTIFSTTGLPFLKSMEKDLKTLEFAGIMTDGLTMDLGDQNPDYVYKTKSRSPLKLLFRNDSLSNDIAQRFGDTHWDEWPLTSEKYMHWLKTIDENGQVINLVMDYAAFGEHHKKATGIFEFLEYLLKYLAEDGTLQMAKVDEVLETCEPMASVKLSDSLSDHRFLQNDMQQDALQTLIGIGRKVAKSSNDDIIGDWRRLQSADHFLYMDDTDGNPFNPYENGYDAFLKYMNVLADFDIRVSEVAKKEPLKKKRIQKKAKKE